MADEADKITHEEIGMIFGDTMPLEAGELLMNPPAGITADALRQRLKEIADKREPAAVLDSIYNDHVDGVVRMAISRGVDQEEADTLRRHVKTAIRLAMRDTVREFEANHETFILRAVTGDGPVAEVYAPVVRLRLRAEAAEERIEGLEDERDTWKEASDREAERITVLKAERDRLRKALVMARKELVHSWGGDERKIKSSATMFGIDAAIANREEEPIDTPHPDSGPG